MTRRLGPRPKKWSGRSKMARRATVEDIGQSAMVSATASLVLQIVLPAICLLMMWRLRRSGDGIVPQPN